MANQGRNSEEILEDLNASTSQRGDGQDLAEGGVTVPPQTPLVNFRRFAPLGETRAPPRRLARTEGEEQGPIPRDVQDWAWEELAPTYVGPNRQVPPPPARLRSNDNDEPYHQAFAGPWANRQVPPPPARLRNNDNDEEGEWEEFEEAYDVDAMLSQPRAITPLGPRPSQQQGDSLAQLNRRLDMQAEQIAALIALSKRLQVPQQPAGTTPTVIVNNDYMQAIEGLRAEVAQLTDETQGLLGLRMEFFSRFNLNLHMSPALNSRMSSDYAFAETANALLNRTRLPTTQGVRSHLTEVIFFFLQAESVRLGEVSPMTTERALRRAAELRDAVMGLRSSRGQLRRNMATIADKDMVKDPPARTHQRDSRDRQHPNTACQWCKKSGHTVNNCPLLERSSNNNPRWGPGRGGGGGGSSGRGGKRFDRGGGGFGRGRGGTTDAVKSSFVQ